MLKASCDKQVEKMKNYYRTSDMLNLLYFFPNLSPIVDLTIVENQEDFVKNYDFLKTLKYGRIDCLKGNPIINSIECSGNSYEQDLIKAKSLDPDAVLVLFNTKTSKEERFEHYAGIAVSVNVGENVTVEAVGKGFDGRELSKGICCHERYFIPWFDLRKSNIENFQQFKIYEINNVNYKKTRENRIEFLTSVGFDKSVVENAIPEKYNSIPEFIWESVVINLLKVLEKQEDFLTSHNAKNFCISGNTDGKKFKAWQMFDKERYLC